MRDGVGVIRHRNIINICSVSIVICLFNDTMSGLGYMASDFE